MSNTWQARARRSLTETERAALTWNKWADWAFWTLAGALLALAVALLA